MRPYIATCHLHDNNGYCDSHSLPGDGTNDWNRAVRQLGECPALLSIQNETNFFSNRVAVARAAKAFDILAGGTEDKNTALRELAARRRV